jgi:nicotinamidase-related amidase
VAGRGARFRQKGLPVAFSQFVYSPAVPLLVGDLHPEHRPAAPGAPTGFGRPSSSCLLGDPSVEVVPELAPAPGELAVRKHWYDAFAGTPLDGALRAQGVGALVVTGTMTDISVLATVVGAFNREYRVTVVEDGVATLWPEIQATPETMRRAYARVVSARRSSTGVLVVTPPAAGRGCTWKRSSTGSSSSGTRLGLRLAAAIDIGRSGPRR